MTPFLIGPGKVEYSSIRASNGKFILVQRTDGFIELYRIDGSHVRTLPSELRTSTGVTLDWISDDHAYCIGGRQLWRRNLLTDAVELIATFPQFVELSAKHIEGDLTRSGYLALCGVDESGVESVFTYNVRTRETGIAHQQDETFDGLKVAEDGTMLLSKSTGILAIPPVGLWYPLTSVNGHACPAVHEGRPILLWCNAAETGIENPAFFNAVEMVDIAQPENRRALKSFDWAYAMHISGEIVSVYDDPNDPIHPITKGLNFQIWRVPLDSSTPTLLHEWTGPYQGYDSAPKATYNNGLILYSVDNGDQVNVWGLRVAPIEVEATPKTPEFPGFSLVSLEKEADADYLMVLPVRGGKALPWKMFRRTL